MTDFRVVLARAGFPQLAEKFKAIRPAPVVRIENGVEAVITDHGTYGQRYGATVVWGSRKWD